MTVPGPGPATSTQRAQASKWASARANAWARCDETRIGLTSFLNGARITGFCGRASIRQLAVAILGWHCCFPTWSPSCWAGRPLRAARGIAAPGVAGTELSVLWRLRGSDPTGLWPERVGCLPAVHPGEFAQAARPARAPTRQIRAAVLSVARWVRRRNASSSR